MCLFMKKNNYKKYEKILVTFDMCKRNSRNILDKSGCWYKKKKNGVYIININILKGDLWKSEILYKNNL